MTDTVLNLAEALRAAEQCEGAAEEYLGLAETAIAHLAAAGMLVRGPAGDPLDVRPLVSMFMPEHVGLLKRVRRAEVRAELIDEMRKALAVRGWPDGLYDACLAAAEVAP